MGLFYPPGPNKLGKMERIALLAESPFSITEHTNSNSSHMMAPGLVDKYPEEYACDGRPVNRFYKNWSLTG